VLEVSDLRLSGGAISTDSRVAADESDEIGEPAEEEDDLGALREDLIRLLQSDRQEIYRTVERLLVTTVFEHCDRNQVHTAKRLGLSRNIVRAQLMRYGLLRKAQPAVVRGQAHNGAFAPA
jgi:sigma-54-specific transcriptional regulator